MRVSVQSLAAGLRVALEMLGIFGDWTEKLAAGDLTDFPALLKEMDGLPERQREQLRGLLLGRWAELDPAGGASLLVGEPIQNDLTHFLKHWVLLDFQWYNMPKFTAVLAGMTDPAMRAAAIEGAMDNLAWLDPTPVTVWARSLPEEERRLVAGELTRRLPDLTPHLKKELIDPLK